MILNFTIKLYLVVREERNRTAVTDIVVKIERYASLTGVLPRAAVLESCLLFYYLRHVLVYTFCVCF